MYNECVYNKVGVRMDGWMVNRLQSIMLQNLLIIATFWHFPNFLPIMLIFMLGMHYADNLYL